MPMYYIKEDHSHSETQKDLLKLSLKMSHHNILIYIICYLNFFDHLC